MIMWAADGSKKPCGGQAQRHSPPYKFIRKRYLLIKLTSYLKITLECFIETLLR